MTAPDSHAGPHYCPACFYLLRANAMTQNTPEAWNRFETYLTHPQDEIVMDFMANAPVDQVQQARQRATAIVAYREGRNNG